MLVAHSLSESKRYRPLQGARPAEAAKASASESATDYAGRATATLRHLRPICRIIGG